MVFTKTAEESMAKGPPPGIKLIQKLLGSDAGLRRYRYSVLVLTFIAYACYHSARKPFSVVKSVLDDVETGLTHVNESHAALHPFLPVNHLVYRQQAINGSHHPHWFYGSHGRNFQSVNGSAPAGPHALQGWAPFNKKGGKGLLGDVDLAFLGSYAVGMYFSGHFGDILDLRYFLSAGMIGGGLVTCVFGVAYWLDIHTIYYFLIVQIIAGLLQSTGWPAVVSIMGKWFGKRNRGLIMGIWNAHTSVGNITGTLLAAGGLTYGWGWSFLLPGLVQAAGGLLVFFFLCVSPSVVGLRMTGEEGNLRRGLRSFNARAFLDKHDVETGGMKGSDADANVVAGSGNSEGDRPNTSAGDEEAGLLQSPQQGEDGSPQAEYKAVTFVEAWNIPGVAPFAFCLFFSKLVAYTFLNWLPFYITQTKIGGRYLSDQAAGTLSTLFDVGGVVGGIIAGQLSDTLKARAMTASGFVYSAVPALFLYRLYGSVSLSVNIVLMMIAGMLVNGPYSLITTAVSADLGTHKSLKGSPRALATVTAIIDGTGSVGAAIGPLLTGYISELSWDYVFLFLMLSACMAGLLLTPLVIAEVREKTSSRQNPVVPSSKDVQQADGGGEL